MLAASQAMISLSLPPSLPPSPPIPLSLARSLASGRKRQGSHTLSLPHTQTHKFASAQTLIGRSLFPPFFSLPSELGFLASDMVLTPLGAQVTILGAKTDSEGYDASVHDASVAPGWACWNAAMCSDGAARTAHGPRALALVPAEGRGGREREPEGLQTTFKVPGGT